MSELPRSLSGFYDWLSGFCRAFIKLHVKLPLSRKSFVLSCALAFFLAKACHWHYVRINDIVAFLIQRDSQGEKQTHVDCSKSLCRTRTEE